MRAADWYFDFLSPFSYLQLVQFDRLPPDLEIAYRPVLFAGLLGHWKHKGPAEIPAKRVHTYRWCHWYAARHGIPFRMPPAHPFNPLRPLRLAVAQGAEPALIRAVFDAIWVEGRDLSRDEEWQALTERLAIPDADEAIARPEVNPLRPLRLAVAQGAEPALIRAVFDAIWVEGRDLSRDEEWQALTERLAIALAKRVWARRSDAAEQHIGHGGEPEAQLVGAHGAGRGSGDRWPLIRFSAAGAVQGQLGGQEALKKGTVEAAERGVFGVPTFAIGGELFWGFDSTDLVLDYLNDPALLATGEYARISDLPIAQARKL